MTKIVDVSNGDLAIVDDDAPEWVFSKPWTTSSWGYPQISYKGRHFFLHRVIMSAKKGQIVDHINGDPLDNRKCNLRLVSQSNNTWNQCTLGVTFAANGWQVQIQKHGKEYYIGRFKTFEEALTARIAAEKERSPVFIRESKNWCETYYWLNRRSKRKS